MLTDLDISSFRHNGFIIKPILNANEVSMYLNKVHEELKHDMALADKMMNVQFTQPGRCIQGIQDIICNKTIIGICSDLLRGGEIILDGASLLCARSGVSYTQGWHRDVMQLKDEEIRDDWFTREFFYNNIQINVPLIADKCLWFVKGSHARPFNEVEHNVFKGSKKMAPAEPAAEYLGECIALQPGDAIFYNNLAIHKGYAKLLMNDRVTIQLGYHSTKYKPTYHFGVLDHEEYVPEYLDRLLPQVVKMLKAHIEEKQRYCNIKAYHGGHQNFINDAFRVVKY